MSCGLVAVATDQDVDFVAVVTVAPLWMQRLLKRVGCHGVGCYGVVVGRGLVAGGGMWAGRQDGVVVV